MLPQNSVRTYRSQMEDKTFLHFASGDVMLQKNLKMNHFMSVVVKTVNFIRVCSLNHHQFATFISDNDVHAGLMYHTDVRWLSKGAVMKRFV